MCYDRHKSTRSAPISSPALARAPLNQDSLSGVGVNHYSRDGVNKIGHAQHNFDNGWIGTIEIDTHPYMVVCHSLTPGFGGAAIGIELESNLAVFEWYNSPSEWWNPVKHFASAPQCRLLCLPMSAYKSQTPQNHPWRLTSVSVNNQ